MRCLYQSGLFSVVLAALSISLILPSLAYASNPSSGFYKEVVRRLPSQTTGTIDDIYYEVDQQVTIWEGDKVYWAIKVDYTYIHGSPYETGLLLCSREDKWSRNKTKVKPKLLDVLELGDKMSIDAYVGQLGTDDEYGYQFGTLIFAVNHYGEEKTVCAYQGRWNVLLVSDDALNLTVFPGAPAYYQPPEAVIEIKSLTSFGEPSDYQAKEGKTFLLWMDRWNIAYPPDAASWQITPGSLLFLQYYPTTGRLYAYKLHSGGTTYGREEAPEPEELQAVF